MAIYLYVYQGEVMILDCKEYYKQVLSIHNSLPVGWENTLTTCAKRLVDDLYTEKITSEDVESFSKFMDLEMTGRDNLTYYLELVRRHRKGYERGLGQTLTECGITIRCDAELISRG